MQAMLWKKIGTFQERKVRSFDLRGHSLFKLHSFFITVFQGHGVSKYAPAAAVTAAADAVFKGYRWGNALKNTSNRVFFVKWVYISFKNPQGDVRNVCKHQADICQTSVLQKK